jgi:hypothetical protein
MATGTIYTGTTKHLNYQHHNKPPNMTINRDEVKAFVQGNLKTSRAVHDSIDPFIKT